MTHITSDSMGCTVTVVCVLLENRTKGKKMCQTVEIAKVFKHAILLRFGKGLSSTDPLESGLLTSIILTSGLLASVLPD